MDGRIDFVGQWFFVISYRYGACGTAYDELRPTDDGCGDCRSFFFSRSHFVLVSLSCVLHRKTRTTEIFNYLRKLAARWVIERKNREGTERPRCEMNNREICEICKVKLEICEILILRGKSLYLEQTYFILNRLNFMFYSLFAILNITSILENANPSSVKNTNKVDPIS